MRYRNVWMMVFLIGLLPAGQVAHAAPEAAPPAARGFTPTTTHIEADPWRVFKVEKPEPMAPRNVDVSTSGDNQTATLVLNWLGLIDLQEYDDSQGRPCSKNVGFVRIPFFRSFHVNRDGVLIWKNDQMINWYWFALLDGVAEKNFQKKNALGGNTTYARLAFFDAPLIFTGYKAKFEAPQSFYWEALDLPLSNTISHKTDKNKSEWRVLNVPLFWGWRYDQDQQAERTYLLITPLGGVYEQVTSTGADGKPLESRRILPMIIGDVYHECRGGDEPSLGLLELPRIYGSHLFALYHMETRQVSVVLEAGSHQARAMRSIETQYLKLPFLGPVYGSWSNPADPSGPHWSIFPKIFRWKQAPQSMRTIF